MFRQLEGESPYPSSSLVVNPGVRVAGGRTYLGRSAAGHGIVTEGEGIGSDRVAEVSKGPNTP
jgi:hypothetical protein